MIRAWKTRRPPTRRSKKNKEIARLRTRLAKVEGELDKANKVIEIQGKLSALLDRIRHGQRGLTDGRNEVIDDAICQLTPIVGVRRACRAVGEIPGTLVSPSSWIAHHQRSPNGCLA